MIMSSLPKRIRTSGLSLRRRTLYPAELPGVVFVVLLPIITIETSLLPADWACVKLTHRLSTGADTTVGTAVTWKPVIFVFIHKYPREDSNL